MAHLPENGAVTVITIGVGGASTAGKTTLALALSFIFGRKRTRVIHMDNYYHELHVIPRDRESRHVFDDPHAFRMEDFLEAIEDTRRLLHTPDHLDDYPHEIAPPNLFSIKLVKMKCEMERKLLEVANSLRENANLPPLDRFRFLIVEGILVYADTRAWQNLDIMVYMPLTDSEILSRRRHRKLHYLKPTEQEEHYRVRTETAVGELDDDEVADSLYGEGSDVFKEQLRSISAPPDPDFVKDDERYVIDHVTRCFKKHHELFLNDNQHCDKFIRLESKLEYLEGVQIVLNKVMELLEKKMEQTVQVVGRRMSQLELDS